MTFLLSLLLPFVVTAVMVGVAAFLWRGSLPSQWAFAFLGSLTLLGLHRVLQAIAAFITPLFVSGGGYFLEPQKQQSFMQLAQSAISTEAVVLAVLLAGLGWPLLSWLRVLLAK